MKQRISSFAVRNLVFALLLLVSVSSRAQFYTSITSPNASGTKVWLGYGGVSTTGTPSAVIGHGIGVPYSDKIKAESVDFDIQPSAMLSLQMHRENSKGVAHGFGFTFQYSTYQWMADFSSESMGNPNYRYRAGKKSKALFFGMGYEFEYRPVDRLVLGAGAGIGGEVQFARQHRAEAVHLATGTLYPSADSEWHDMVDDNYDVNMDINFSLYGRLTAQYYITQTVFVGVALQLKQTLAGTANPHDLTTYQSSPAGFNICVLEGNFSRLSYLLTLGFDL